MHSESLGIQKLCIKIYIINYFLRHVTAQLPIGLSGRFPGSKGSTAFGSTGGLKLVELALSAVSCLRIVNQFVHQSALASRARQIVPTRSAKRCARWDDCANLSNGYKEIKMNRTKM